MDMDQMMSLMSLTIQEEEEEITLHFLAREDTAHLLLALMKEVTLDTQILDLMKEEALEATFFK